MKLLINIRGCNGSGKSTIVLSMMDDPEKYMVQKPYKGKTRKVLTVFPSWGFVALGSYENKCGGLDGYPDTNMVKKALWYALKRFPQYHIIMEGILPSTVFSTYLELFKEVEQKYPERKVVVLNLLPPLETCLKRIQKRNGGKPIKEELVASKWSTVAKNADKFSDMGILSLKWDNSTLWPKYKDMPMVRLMTKFIAKSFKQDTEE